MQPLQFTCKKLPIPLLGFAVLLLISLASSCTEQEKNSLLQFLAGLLQDAGLAKLWQEGKDCCEWEGIVCSGNRTVIEVSLEHRGLEGSITHLLSNRTDSSVLQYFGLGNCSKLRVLKAGYNYLSGTLPDELFNATSLEHLSFPRNGLQGMLDGTHIFKLSNLAILDLGENKFSGMISDSIDQLKRLQELHLDYNNMSGELPSTLSNCTNLITLDLKCNNFSGELHKVGFSNFPNLKTLDLLLNDFSGTIPESIYPCRNLIALRLSGNKFHGQLSKGLGNLKSLSFLSLGNSFSNITNTLQIRSSKNLTTLLLGMNFMNETMPDNARIDGFENLRVLDMYGSLLSGEIPLWISELANLEMLSLQGNRLSGSIPAWINTLEYLFYLDISNNNLTGEIPTTLMAMPMLTSEKTVAHLDKRVFDLPVYHSPSLELRVPIALPKALYLSRNKFTGVIPPEIGQLEALISLNISFNNLTGPIPRSICNLTNLEQLDLSNNNLRGEIPAALENLHFLSDFDISNNDMEGPIPTGGQFFTFPNSSFAGNPRMCGPGLNHHCTSVEVGPPTGSRGLCGSNIVFPVSFSVFVGVGVLYDQMVLSRYFG
ncbi:hypothetical protein SETIT_1G007100v2 [Setaria italica]|uniref:Uncharacterized protein n=1 Tax=Setaria italica TaxID=4555 RepID=A0A368PFR8_SETIT|nr:hypothetical protein SETIT_1G007100v2 [Setaria italica]